MNDYLVDYDDQGVGVCSVCGASVLDQEICPNSRACDGGCNALIHDRGDGLCKECREKH